MKPILFLFVALMLVGVFAVIQTPHVHATGPAYVQECNNTFHSSTSGTCSFTPTAGDWAFIQVTQQSGSYANEFASDNHADNFGVLAFKSASCCTLDGRMWGAKLSSSSSTTFTVSFDGSPTYWTMVVVEYSGVLDVRTPDGNAVATTGSSPFTVTETLDKAADFAICGVGYNQATSSDSWTSGTEEIFVDGNSNKASSAIGDNTGSTSVTCSGTDNGGSGSVSEAVDALTTTYIQYVGGAAAYTTSSVNTLTVTYSSTTGNTYFIEITFRHGSGQTISSVTDTASDTITSLVEDSSNTLRDSALWATAAGGGHASTSFTVTLSANSNPVGIGIAEYSGVGNLGSTTDNIDSAGSNPMIATQSLSAANDRAICSLETWDGATAGFGDNGFIPVDGFYRFDNSPGSGSDNIASFDATGGANGICAANTYANTPRFIALAVDAEVSAPPAFDYSLSNDGPVTIQSGETGTVTITATIVSGSGSVTLSCNSLPSGITCNSFGTNPVSPTATSLLTIGVANTVTAGTYTFHVAGSPTEPSSADTVVTVDVTDYTISNNGPVTIQAVTSGTGSGTVTITLTDGTPSGSEAQTLSCSGLTSGMTCYSFGTNPVTPTGTSLLTIHTDNTISATTYTFSVCGDDPVNCTTVTVYVTDYTISNNGPVTIQTGDAGTVTITLTEVTVHGSTAQTLSCSGLTAGMTCYSFSVNPVTPTGTSLLTIHTTTAVTAGTYTFDVSGDDPVHSTTVTVYVTDYTIMAASASIQRGSSGTSLITLTQSTSHGSSAQTLSCTSLPPGVTCTSFSTNPVTPTGTSTLHIAVAFSVTPGSYSFSVCGNDPVHCASVALTVSGFDYSISNTSPVSVVTGGSVQVNINVAMAYGTSPSITLACGSLPTGFSCSGIGGTHTAPFIVTLTVSVTGVGPGIYTFPVNLTPAGDHVSSTTITVDVVVYDFKVSSGNGSFATCQAGQDCQVAINLNLISGTPLLETLSVSGLPSGITFGGFSPSACTPTCSTTLTLHIDSGVSANTYSFTVSAMPTGYFAAHSSVTITITVASPPDLIGGPLTIISFIVIGVMLYTSFEALQSKSSKRRQQ